MKLELRSDLDELMIEANEVLGEIELAMKEIQTEEDVKRLNILHGRVKNIQVKLDSSKALLEADRIERVNELKHKLAIKRYKIYFGPNSAQIFESELTLQQLNDIIHKQTAVSSTRKFVILKNMSAGVEEDFLINPDNVCIIYEAPKKPF